MPIQGPLENWPLPASSNEEEVKPIHKVSKDRLRPSSTIREQYAKNENFLHDRLVIAFGHLHTVLKAVAFIPSKLINQLSGKIESKALAKDINHLSKLLKARLADHDSSKVFQTKCSPADKKRLLELLKNNKKIELMSAALIAEGITDLGRSYFILQAKKKLVHSKGSEMKEALTKLQDIFNWIVENQDKTEMSWTNLMINVPVLFKLMKAENQTIQYKNAQKVEKEFLTLVLNKLIEDPSDTERERTLFPIMNQFSKANNETKQKILDSLKTIEF